MAEHLTGLIAPPPTPMEADGALNLETVEAQAAALVEDGVAGAFVCGTTGESASLTVAERMEVAERWASVAAPDFAVIVQVGHDCLADCRLLAQHAERIGARAIGCLPPHFFKPASIADLIAFCVEVAAAAPELPFYYYHIPAMTGVTFPVADVLAAGAEQIPTLAGAKFTHEDLMDFGRCVELDGGRFNMLFGRDEMLLAGLALGARGAVGTTYNCAAPLYGRIMRAFEAGDLTAARAEQAHARDLVTALRRFGIIAATKAVMAMNGIDCGPVRPPLRDLTAEERGALRAELERIGFFDWAV